jgi:hypothetical protein
MKKLFTTFIALALLATTGIGQSESTFPYHTRLVNNKGEVFANTNSNINVSILQDSPSGLVAYSETHETTTNESGLAFIKIGSGKSTWGNFDQIDWTKGTYYIRIGMQQDTGHYISLGTPKMLNVNYYTAQMGKKK